MKTSFLRLIAVTLVLIMIVSTLVACTQPVEPPATEPTAEPTAAPTDPTDAPTVPPTEAPTTAPTEAPTAAPTEAPTAAPTEKPTTPPAEKPTTPPTEKPTTPPTEKPTIPPTEKPTTPPTEKPTTPPTEKPTEAPTQKPTDPPAPDNDIGKVIAKDEYAITVTDVQHTENQYVVTFTLTYSGEGTHALSAKERVFVVNSDRRSLAVDDVYDTAGNSLLGTSIQSGQTMTIKAVFTLTEEFEPTAFRYIYDIMGFRRLQAEL